MKEIWDRIKSFFIKWNRFFLNLGLALAVGIAMILFVFYIFLPNYTNHRETITVPDLNGVQYDQLDEFLTKRNLRYEVVPDSEYVEQSPALAIMRQYPKPGNKVKENRKIYVTLNATTPPKVNMPDLLNKTYNTAKVILTNTGLREGNLKYINDISENKVLQQQFEGEPILEGTPIPKGSRIDLVVSMGLGKAEIPTPDLLGKNIAVANFILAGTNLQTGAIMEVARDDEARGIVLRQVPAPGEMIREGEVVDIWVTPYQEQDSIGFAQEPMDLDEITSDEEPESSDEEELE